MTRRNCRIIAFQAMYSQEIGKLDVNTIMNFEWLDESQRDKLDDESRIFIHLLLNGTIEKCDEIDAMISKHLTNWNIERLNKVDLAILRISVYPLIYQKDMAPSIIIDEAVDISKKFGSNESYKFVNGVLDNISKDIAQNSEI